MRRIGILTRHFSREVQENCDEICNLFFQCLKMNSFVNQLFILKISREFLNFSFEEGIFDEGNSWKI